MLTEGSSEKITGLIARLIKDYMTGLPHTSHMALVKLFNRVMLQVPNRVGAQLFNNQYVNTCYLHVKIIPYT